MEANSNDGEALRRTLLADMELWTAPPGAGEAELAREITGMRFVTVERLDDRSLQRFGMHPKNCHANVANYIERTRLKSARRLTGWWQLGNGAYVLHSVVATARRWFCVTPFFGERQLTFAPDAALRATPKGVTGEFTRGGVAVPVHVRYDRDRVVVECEAIRTRLLSGMDPMRAIELPEAEQADRFSRCARPDASGADR